MIIEIQSDSDVWSVVKHALREAGYHYMLQANLFERDRTTLFIEPLVEPEGGKMVGGMIVYEGGAKLTPYTLQEVYEQQVKK